MWLLIAICGIAFALAITCHGGDNNGQDDVVVNHIKKVLNNHFQNSTNAEQIWWLVNTTRNFNEEEIKQLNESVDAIMACMPQFKDLNETTKRIYGMMTNVSCAVYQGTISNNWTFQAIRAGGPPLVMFIPSSLSAEPIHEHGKVGVLFTSAKDKGIVFVPGLNGSRTALAALYYHEFSHLLQQIDIDPSLAEAESHQLSIAISIHGKPEYRKKIQEIVRRGEFKSFKAALGSITVQDLKEMDDILMPAEVSSRRMSLWLQTQHVLAVGFAYDDMTGQGSPAHKAGIYKFVSGNL